MFPDLLLLADASNRRNLHDISTGIQRTKSRSEVSKVDVFLYELETMIDRLDSQNHKNFGCGSFQMLLCFMNQMATLCKLADILREFEVCSERAW